MVQDFHRWLTGTVLCAGTESAAWKIFQRRYVYVLALKAVALEKHLFISGPGYVLPQFELPQDR